MRKLLTLILILCTIAAPAQMRGGALYDPGAIRSDGTNASDTVTLNRVRTATGTAAAPAYTFSSDPDTGIYSPGANTIGFGVGGAENVRISAGGNVLIATSTDDGANKLQVNGRIKATDIALRAPAVLAVSNRAFPVPNSTSTVATWTSEVYDDNSNFDHTTGVFTAPISGFYDIWAKSVWDANAAGNRMAFFEKNGGREKMPATGTPASSATQYPEFCIGGIVYLAAGDTLRLGLFQNSGGSLNTIGQANEGALSITYLRGR